ncbi:MAG: hypothetical protein H7281_11360 [Bacteriovorax sp.]|nr:hypothetical protein [Bacteriovorax sp.]
MSAVLLYHSKLTLIHSVSKMIAIAELKVWKVDDFHAYPEGIKYSFFCVDRTSGSIIIGLDNHKPKGPHKHLNGIEEPYQFNDCDHLVNDFWNEVRKLGFDL